MPVKINGSTSGSTTITAPATGTDETIELSTALAAKLASADYKPGLAYITSGTATAASSISINSCFTATYDNYLIAYSGVASADGDIQMRLRVSGTDNSAANYSYQVAYLNNTSNNSTRATGQTSFARIAGGNTDVVYASIVVVRPAIAAPTGVVTQNIYTTTGGVFYNTAGLHTASTAFDGFTLYPASGTLTGTCRVYGYAIT